MKNALICSAGQCNFSPNSPLIFDLYLFLLIDKKHNKLHLCFLLTIPSTNYSTTFTWLPNASGALSTRLTTIEQNKCLSFFFFFSCPSKYNFYLESNKVYKAIFATLDTVKPNRESQGWWLGLKSHGKTLLLAVWPEKKILILCTCQFKCLQVSNVWSLFQTHRIKYMPFYGLPTPGVLHVSVVCAKTKLCWVFV